ncbi:MAG: hypothetical protein V4538_00160 [Bacteroidota bacterium]
MGPTKIMIIRHAEKPGPYGGVQYNGINAVGTTDETSLVTMGWERAGGIANLFYPTNNVFQHAKLAKPDFIYAADPAVKKDGDEPSQRPYQTISALAAKMNLPSGQVNISFKKKDFKKMVTHVLTLSGTVLISWQHQDILPKTPGTDCIVHQLMKQTGTQQSTLQQPVPAGPWPAPRYDMVLVFDRPTGTGPFTSFTPIPQLLLAGDLSTLFPA